MSTPTIRKNTPNFIRWLFLAVMSASFFIMNPHVVTAGMVTGNAFKNYLFGTMQADTITGEGDSDSLFGLAGADKISGGNGKDIIEGNQGNDFLDGNDGNDRIIGGQDADSILGGDGNDLLMASYAVNSSSVRDFASDSLMCGLGNDTAFLNPEDNDTASSDCENIISDFEPFSLAQNQTTEITKSNNSNII
jgi:Ca2+-binding RTX toxin-like protein